MPAILSHHAVGTSRRSTSPAWPPLFPAQLQCSRQRDSRCTSRVQQLTCMPFSALPRAAQDAQTIPSMRDVFLGFCIARCLSCKFTFPEAPYSTQRLPRVSCMKLFHVNVPPVSSAPSYNPPQLQCTQEPNASCYPRVSTACSRERPFIWLYRRSMKTT